MVVSLLWRETADDLPEEGTNVLLCMQGEDEPLIGYWEHGSELGAFRQWYNTEYGGPMDDEPRFWAHLPELPEMKPARKKMQKAKKAKGK
jgi:hypothetical protein